MHNNRRNILTAILCCSFILSVFYGNLLEYPTIGIRHQIHTIHLNVRLDKHLKPLNNPFALTNVKGLEDPLRKTEVAKEPSQEADVAKEPSHEADVAKEPLQEADVAKEPSQETEVAKDRKLNEVLVKTEVAKEPSQETEVAKDPSQEATVAEDPKFDVEDKRDTFSNQEFLQESWQDIEVPKIPATDEKGQEDHLSDFGKFKVRNSSFHILEKHFLIFLVPSTPDSWEFRNSMRTKWLNLSCWRKEEFQGIDARHLDFKLMFIIGTDARKNFSQGFLEEISQNDDMYLMDIPESREILKDKVLYGMKESIKRFDYDFLIKFDHDTLVDLPRLGSGVTTLSKKNLFTGSCGYHVWFETIQRKVRYCSGGAYILSSDVVQKIAELSEAETNVTLGKEEPEDAYIGVLVKTVNKKFNIPKLRHKHRREIVNRYRSKPGHFWFRTWFFHGVKGWRRMDRGFNCRVTADLNDCPPKQFFYKNENAAQCVCDVNKNPLWKY